MSFVKRWVQVFTKATQFQSGIVKGWTRGEDERENNAYRILVRICLGSLPFAGSKML
jgi:hypothetical protein